MPSYVILLVNEPLATRPQEKRANAPSVMTPSTMLIKDKGFFTALNDAIADNQQTGKPSKTQRHVFEQLIMAEISF